MVKSQRLLALFIAALVSGCSAIPAKKESTIILPYHLPPETLGYERLPHVPQVEEKALLR